MKHFIFSAVLIIGLYSSYVFGEEKNCHCAVFEEKNPVGIPVIERNPMVNLECNDEGRENCKKLCAALAQAGKDQAAAMLCNAVKVTKNLLEPSVYSKVCKDETWEYTGLSNNEPICCLNGTSITCPQKGL